MHLFCSNNTKISQKIPYPCGFPQVKGFFVFAETASKLLQIDKKVDNLQKLAEIIVCRLKRTVCKMAMVKENLKDGKAVSYKLKACPGRLKERKEYMKQKVHANNTLLEQTNP